MRKALVAILLLALTPVANAADPGGGSAPAPAPTVAKPTPMASTTPSSTPTPAPVATASPTPAIKTVATELVAIRGLIAENNFKAALTELKRADGIYKNNADINNLLGYSSRKLLQYKQADTYYIKALKIDPKHLGALEYQGELYVLTNKIPAAKKNLSRLMQLCGAKCEEYLDLKKAIGSR